MNTATGARTGNEPALRKTWIGCLPRLPMLSTAKTVKSGIMQWPPCEPLEPELPSNRATSQPDADLGTNGSECGKSRSGTFGPFASRSPLPPASSRHYASGPGRNVETETATMEDTRITVRGARAEDAHDLAKLIDIAGEGIPSCLWARTARSGETPLDVGVARARRDSGGFSYRNALVAVLNGRVAGMVLGYMVTAPTEEDRAALPELPEPIRPMVELEQLPESVGSFYVNALAVRPGLRGYGIGSRLLAAAEQRAATLGCDRMTIQVFSQNQGALALYRRSGYATAASRPVLLHPCQPYYDEDILLLGKELSPS